MAPLRPASCVTWKTRCGLVVAVQTSTCRLWGSDPKDPPLSETWAPPLLGLRLSPVKWGEESSLGRGEAGRPRALGLPRPGECPPHTTRFPRGSGAPSPCRRSLDPCSAPPAQPLLSRLGFSVLRPPPPCWARMKPDVFFGGANLLEQGPHDQPGGCRLSEQPEVRGQQGEDREGAGPCRGCAGGPLGTPPPRRLQAELCRFLLSSTACTLPRTPLEAAGHAWPRCGPSCLTH